MVGFMGDRLLPLGTIGLSIIVRARKRQVTKVIDFLVVDCPSAYNAILGRLMLN